MQHWVLCETLKSLESEPFQHLQFICPYSMAPWSIPESIDYAAKNSPTTHRRRYFDEVRHEMGERPTSTFEWVWRQLSIQSGLPYPSSAVFAWNLWPRELSLLLCESNPDTATEIQSWLATPETQARLKEKNLRRGDWRSCFVADVRSTPQADVSYVELDPMMFERRNPASEESRNEAKLYPDDLPRLIDAFHDVETAIVLQVSTYDCNNDNSLALVEPAIREPLEQAGFQLMARVSPNGNMMSLVLSRGIQLWTSPEILGTRFNRWLND